MQRHQYTHFFLLSVLRQKLHALVLKCRIQTGDRLIEQQVGMIVKREGKLSLKNHARELNTLLLSPRQSQVRPIRDRFQTQGVHGKALRKLPIFGANQSLEWIPPHLHDLRNGEVKRQARGLWKDCTTPRLLLHSHLIQRYAIETDLAVSCDDLTSNGRDQGGFTCAVCAQQADDLAWMNLKADRLEDRAS